MTDDRDYDALAAKLAEVEEMKRLLAMDKINLRGELAGVQGKLAAANDQLDSARHSVTVLEGRADHFKARAEAAEAERDKFHQLWKDACVRSGKNSLRADAAEAALPAVYRLALGDAAERFDEIAQHDQGGIDYSDLVGIPISNREQLVKSVQDAERDAKAIRALPTPTAAELMARIHTGEKE